MGQALVRKVSASGFNQGYPINRISGEYENPKFNSQLIVEVQ